jgi:CubicO group peptidase (beta-lactamase class C family)
MGEVRARTAAAIVMLAVVAACTSNEEPDKDSASDAPTSSVVYPTADWARQSPAAAGFDAAALRSMDRTLGNAGTTCVVVTRNGRLVHEKYWGEDKPDTARAVFSVTKSFTSMLVGIAADEGKLSLDDPASTYIPQWRGTPSEDVTIRDLLSNDSGRHWDTTTDYTDMAVKADDKTAFSIALGQDAPPGTVWVYNNSAIQTLSAVLEKATGESPSAYARKHIFGPLGMKDTVWLPDRSGHTPTYAGISSTCRDLARFGYLAMRKGRWDEAQVVSPGYVAQATGESSTKLNAAYGLLWWVNHRGTVLGAITATGPSTNHAAGRLSPRSPEDAFWALGLGRQIVAVIPSEGVVAVRMGYVGLTPATVNPDTFTGAVLDALD